MGYRYSTGYRGFKLHKATDTILVVDDAPENLSVLAELLHGAYTVRVAASGERALDDAYLRKVEFQYATMLRYTDAPVVRFDGTLPPADLHAQMVDAARRCLDGAECGSTECRPGARLAE